MLASRRGSIYTPDLQPPHEGAQPPPRSQAVSRAPLDQAAQPQAQIFAPHFLNCKFFYQSKASVEAGLA